MILKTDSRSWMRYTGDSATQPRGPPLARGLVWICIWFHYCDIISAPQTNGNSTICTKIVQSNAKETAVESPYKRTLAGKAFPYHDVIMFEIIGQNLSWATNLKSEIRPFTSILVLWFEIEYNNTPAYNLHLPWSIPHAYIGQSKTWQIGGIVIFAYCGKSM